MSHPNEEVIEKFYTAFGKLDAEAMASCYAADVEFSDPAFPSLRGRSAGDMWRMLTGRAKDLNVTFSNVSATDTSGSAHWRAEYSFGPSARFVVNEIDATFTFRDGKIVRHKDQFDFRVWSRQALGPIAYLLGWTPFLQKMVQSNARKQLEKFQAKRR